MFTLTDALASKECDMLLPAHAIKELHAYSDIHVCVVQTVPIDSDSVSGSDSHDMLTACATTTFLFVCCFVNKLVT